MKTELYIARRYLFRGRAKHISFIGIASCFGIALGVATLIIVISVMNGFDKELMDSLMRFSYHLTVECIDSDKLDQIEKLVKSWEETKSASIFLQTQVFAKFDNFIIPLAVKGIDFSDTEEKKTLFKYVTEEKKSEGFFLGEGLRERYLIGSELEFYPLERKLNLQKEYIRGFFKVGRYDIDNNYIITDLEKAKRLSPNYVLSLGIRIKNPFMAGELKRRIVDKMGDGVLAVTWVEANQVLFSALKLEKITMFIILSLIILVACFCIFATLTVKVVEKTKDVGVLKSIGFRRGQILSIFSLQGLLLGFIGSFCGTILGMALCLALKKYPFIKLPEEIYYIEYLPVAINYRDIILIISVGILLSYVFSLFPALKAAKLSPSEALRYE